MRIQQIANYREAHPHVYLLKMRYACRCPICHWFTPTEEFPLHAICSRCNAVFEVLVSRPGILIAARMGSSRLPGKALKPFRGGTVLGSCVDRCLAPGRRVVVITTALPEDAAIHNWGEKHGISIHRGSDTDVLGRVIEAAVRFEIDPVIRITGDCPLTEPSLTLFTLAQHVHSGESYTTTRGRERYNPALDEVFAQGLDVEVIDTTVLARLDRLELTAEEREHVTLGLYLRKLCDPSWVPNNGGWAAPPESYCVDTPDDLIRLEECGAHCG